MIDLYTTKRLTEDAYFNFSHSHSHLSSPEQEAAYAADIGGAVFLSRYSESMTRLLETALPSFMEEHDLYFVYVENFLSPRSKVKSYRGMLKPVLSHLGESNLQEEETAFDQNLTAFSAVLRLTPENLDFCLKQLLNSTLAFGLMTEKGIPPFTEGYPAFFRKLPEMALLYKERITLNFWKLFLRLLDDNRILFRLRAVGIDHQALEFFGKNPVLDPAISSSYERLEKVLYLRRRAGAPVEL